jgi:hypothetical protein
MADNKILQETIVSEYDKAQKDIPQNREWMRKNIK